MGDGDGKVPLVSLDLMSHKGWRTRALNPANFSVTTHELLHKAVPWYRGLRCAFPKPLALTRSACVTPDRTPSVPDRLPPCCLLLQRGCRP